MNVKTEKARDSKSKDGTLWSAIDQACARIAPTWPLDRFIAVNPLWGHVDKPFETVAAKLAAVDGISLLMPRAYYRDLWQKGHLRATHIQKALQETESEWTLADAEALLQLDPRPMPHHARIVDVVDANRDLAHGMSFRDFVVNSISQFCAAYFDEGQAALGPDRSAGLYLSWLSHACRDSAPEGVMGAANVRKHFSDLPDDAEELLAAALDELAIAQSDRLDYLNGLLLDVNGWASWCAYRRWQARLKGDDDGAIVQLLAVRLAWEVVLLRAGGKNIVAQWQIAMGAWPAMHMRVAEAQKIDWVYQCALEIAERQTIEKDLCRALCGPAPKNPAVQAVFCIDVRSEIYRRALEAQSDRVQTVGFAGFFGVPLQYQPAGARDAAPHLPGLLTPGLTARDGADTEALGQSRGRTLDVGAAFKGLRTGAASGFSFVESVGMFYALNLLGDSYGFTRPVADAGDAGLSKKQKASRQPRLHSTAQGDEITLAQKVKVAAGALRGMGLTADFARIVALVGHGAQSVNNPHLAGLHCGACCGQAGDVNARVAAALLNEKAVRHGLLDEGICIPEGTHFVAALHNTTTDEVRVFREDGWPMTHEADMERFEHWLQEASQSARRERAPLLGIDANQSANDIKKAVQGRANDWAQVRPEWGLGNNAFFVAAPRAHSKDVDFSGRAFLHDYDWREDATFAVLEVIFTAPVVVAHWINLQYYASTVDNRKYGSGNKVLHNVVGGNLGVFEGNGGDLRIGLPQQSLHDGDKWMHTPLRLNVFVEAPMDAIVGVLENHQVVRNLVVNQWLFLFQMDAKSGNISPVTMRG